MTDRPHGSYKAQLSAGRSPSIFQASVDSEVLEVLRWAAQTDPRERIATTSTVKSKSCRRPAAMPCRSELPRRSPSSRFTWSSRRFPETPDSEARARPTAAAGAPSASRPPPVHPASPAPALLGRCRSHPTPAHYRCSPLSSPSAFDRPAAMEVSPYAAAVVASIGTPVAGPDPSARQRHEPHANVGPTAGACDGWPSAQSTSR